MTAADVGTIVHHAMTADRPVIHLQGGLVSEASAHRTADRLT